ncbi:GDSL-type esterase/lipase family protein [Pedobacter duraquae]|uniref:Lysophospholipase L1-like esterase n=1 Tax=Pedobacter duraquae TaxID=425511 RepID=A0A4R6ISC4_9SPHI|nr:GDSL-type esterase/lipase family protein [Pedobacter duraquae]TDO24866.1 lysophospholipase L1-like esterase [Pedobacter duraquae]
MKFKLILFLSLIVNVACSQNNNAQTSTTLPAKEDFKDDWANLSKYQKENTALGEPKQGEKRVVFLGSSVFEFWKQKDPGYFAGKAYVDRGIAGQISPQLLLRFRADVIDIKAKAVIILAGSNDIAANTGHITNERIMDNIKSMVELAKANQIKVILCAYLPIIDYPWRKGLEPADKIIALNKLIRAYATQEKLVLLDYFTPFVNEVNGQKEELTVDGVHPNLKGYKIMEAITDQAIAKALK